MSMMGGTGRTPQNVGETVARYGDYESAQKAVSRLIEAEIPAREISIVWAGLKAVEMVTGRMGYARAAWSGALNGAFLGLMFGAIFTLLSPTLSIQVLLGCLLVGVAIGMLMQILTYSLTRRRRDYTSITAPIADHYEIAVSGSHVSSARRVLGGGDRPAGPQAAAPAAPACGPSSQEPPRYGIRIDDRPVAHPHASAAAPGAAGAARSAGRGACRAPPRSPGRRPRAGRRGRGRGGAGGREPRAAARGRGPGRRRGRRRAPGGRRADRSRVTDEERIRVPVALPAGRVEIGAAWSGPRDAAQTVVIAHGAGSGMDHPFLRGFAAGLNDLGVRTLRFEFPYVAAGRRMPGPAAHAILAWRAALAEARSRAERVWACGKSYGGRMASMVAAEGDADVEGLVYLGYPLHPPGRPDKPRTEHLPRVVPPQLFVEGENDPFVDPHAQLEEAVAACRDARIAWVAGAGHSFEVKGARRPADEIGRGLAPLVADFVLTA
ncbi:alpha/beta family hydrolase [Microbacterium sp. Marseille-Q6965]|uniref:alpha/beta family hydrolase n=1 Tax=Microbacterium sp. Marseille-Q6965 TaxID=2965072 RepID=UPI0021B7FA8B|nr:alpha/beta family hydrolase [Microbacterium sp. Marseille-Q6965]